MKEQVGVCCLCGEAVYCLDGFLVGEAVPEGVRCLKCLDKEENGHVTFIRTGDSSDREIWI